MRCLLNSRVFRLRMGFHPIAPAYISRGPTSSIESIRISWRLRKFRPKRKSVPFSCAFRPGLYPALCPSLTDGEATSRCSPQNPPRLTSPKLYLHIAEHDPHPPDLPSPSSNHLLPLLPSSISLVSPPLASHHAAAASNSEGCTEGSRPLPIPLAPHRRGAESSRDRHSAGVRARA